MPQDINKASPDDGRAGCSQWTVHNTQIMCESIIAGTTKLATDKSDTHLFDFLETHFKQMKSILKMDDYVINLCKTGVQKSGITV